MMDQSAVGARLRAERERQGHALTDVARAIKVRGEYLKAIESSALRDAPAFVYLVGYVRKYAEFLGMGAEAVAEDFREERQRLMRMQDAIAIHPTHHHTTWKWWMVGSLFIFVMVLSLWAVVRNPSGMQGQETITGWVSTMRQYLQSKASEARQGFAGAKDLASHALSRQREASTAATASSPPTPTYVENVSAHRGRLVLLARGHTWVKVFGPDDKLLMEKELRAGDTYFAPDEPGIRILASHPNLLDVYHGQD
jgi:cytoskeletal protein RodZ